VKIRAAVLAIGIGVVALRLEPSLAAQRGGNAPAGPPVSVTVNGRQWTQQQLFQRNIGGPDDQTTQFPPHKIIGNLYYVGTASLAAFLVAVPSRGAIGGFSDEAFTANTTAIAKREARENLGQTAGRRWLAAGGCTIPVESRPENIDAARDALVG